MRHCRFDDPWLNFKVMKYYICTDVNVSRYFWYLYYLPLVGIPLYTLFASLFIGKTEDYRLKWQVKLLYIPAALLFLMIMTNDLHEFAFSFPQRVFHRTITNTESDISWCSVGLHYVHLLRFM